MFDDIAITKMFDIPYTTVYLVAIGSFWESFVSHFSVSFDLEEI